MWVFYKLYVAYRLESRSWLSLSLFLSSSGGIKAASHDAASWFAQASLFRFVVDSLQIHSKSTTVVSEHNKSVTFQPILSKMSGVDDHIFVSRTSCQFLRFWTFKKILEPCYYKKNFSINVTQSSILVMSCVVCYIACLSITHSKWMGNADW